jgi:hypothetical protein
LAGWEPATFTRHIYDADGRLVGSVSVPEPEWSPDDVALLVASRQHQQSLGAHGFPMSEATDPANQFAFTGQKAPIVDFFEKARLDDQDKYYKQYDTKETKVNRNGHIWTANKKD